MDTVFSEALNKNWKWQRLIQKVQVAQKLIQKKMIE